MTPSSNTPTSTFDEAIRAAFLKDLPQITSQTRFAFRKFASRDVREDLEAETLALAWQSYARLSRLGKKPEKFLTTLVLRCTQAVKSGRRLAGAESTQDVLSSRARTRRDVRIHPLGDRTSANLIRVEAPVDEEAAFRLDFPRWRSGLPQRDRAVLDSLMGGDGTRATARRFRLSAARVSQLRQAFQTSWGRFHQDAGVER